MSQKTNPISLRLQKTNFSFPLSLFADYFWSDIYKTCFENQNYVTAFLKENYYSQAVFSARVFYRKFSLFLFVQDNRVSKKNMLFFFKNKGKRSSSLQIRNDNTKAFSLTKSEQRINLVDKHKGRIKRMLSLKSENYSFTPKTTPAFIKNYIWSELSEKSIAKVVQYDFLRAKQGFFENNCSLGDCTNLQSTIFRNECVLSKKYAVSSMKIVPRPYFSLCEEIVFSRKAKERANLLFYNGSANCNDQKRLSISSLQKDNSKSKYITKKKSLYEIAQPINRQPALYFPILTTLEAIRFISADQNVMAVLDMVVALIEKRIAFRQIKSLLFKQLALKPEIKGMRISCSGRLGGRSKKAQKAKLQCDSFGTTTLSTFSSKIIFGSKSALTPYGKIGIKVWLSYQNDR